MASEESFWFRVGYALERARLPPSAPAAGSGKRTSKRRSAPAGGRARPASGETGADNGRVTDELLSAGVAAVAGHLLEAWKPRGRARFTRLLRAGAAGAAAALVLDLVKPFLRGDPDLPILDRETGDRMLAGIGQGLLYAGVVEPRVPGPPLVKGALFGSAEYAAEAAGGLSHLLGAHAPQRRIPFVGGILEDLDPRDRVYLEHLAFGVVLAVLYGSSPSSNGILPEDDEDE